MTKNEGDLDTAIDLVIFIIAETTSDNILLQAYQLLLEMKVETAKKIRLCFCKKGISGAFLPALAKAPKLLDCNWIMPGFWLLKWKNLPKPLTL